ncbi:MAG TPA: hypothetical protein VME46_08485 [Acidimicrobiales bacterium]|nr:hypothetical protein [Acidimicrobiales bacterium]
MARVKRRRQRTATRRSLRFFFALLGLPTTWALGGTGYEIALPGVGDAPARVAAVLRSHDEVASGLPLPAKLSDAVVAGEDEHFYSNPFLNVFDGAARGTLASLHIGGNQGEGTIDEQLARQLQLTWAEASMPAGLLC